MKLLPIIFLLFLIAPLGLGQTNITQACVNASELQINITNASTTIIQNLPCQNTCSANICQDSTQQISYLWVFLLVGALLIGLSILLFIRIEDEMMKTMFFFLSLIIVIIVAFVVGSVGEEIGEGIAPVITQIGFVTGIVFVGAMFFFVLQLFRESNKRTLDEFEGRSDDD